MSSDQLAPLASHDCLLYLRDSQAGSWTFACPALPPGKRKPADGAVEHVGVNVADSLKANNSEVLRDALLACLGIGRQSFAHGFPSAQKIPLDA